MPPLYHFGVVICAEHYYGGELPCPWPKCPHGTPEDRIQLPRGSVFRHTFMETFDEPLFAWVIDGKPATKYTLGKLTHSLVAQVNDMPFTQWDGQLYHFGFDIALRTIAEYDDELAPETVSLFREALNRQLPLRTFVACFSLLKESPKHWADYADNGAGVAIRLEPDGFCTLTAADPSLT